MDRDRFHSQDDAKKSYLISQSSFESNMEEFLRELDEREDDAELWAEQLHDDVVIELPFAGGTNIPSRILGKKDCLEYIREWYNLFADFKIYEMKVHRLDEPGAYMLEFKSRGFVAATAKPYKQTSVALLKLRDHKIIYLKEYWNPIKLLEAFGEGFEFELNLNFMDMKSIDPY